MTIRIGKLSRRERLAARQQLAQRTFALAKPEDAALFEAGASQVFDLADPQTCAFLFGKFWEDCQSVEGSQEQVFTMRVTHVDADKGMVTLEPVKP